MAGQSLKVKISGDFISENYCIPWTDVCTCPVSWGKLEIGQLAHGLLNRICKWILCQEFWLH